VPHGIVCLLSALRFHHLTTQSPFETWLAIDSKARLPTVDYPPIRFVRFSRFALTDGIEERPESTQSRERLIHRLRRFHRFKQDWHCFLESVKSVQSVDLLLYYSNSFTMPHPTLR